MSEDQKDEAKAERDAALETLQKNANLENQTRTGKGTRQFCALTRGKGSRPFVYEAFDLQTPATLPESLAEFAKLGNVPDEKALLALAIVGWNDESQSIASDPVAEFIDASWPDDVQKTFRTAVKSTAALLGKSYEEVANMLKPGIIAVLASQPKS